MLSIIEAINKAASHLAHTDVVNDFRNFFVVIDNHVPEMDSSANMVAVEKSTGSCCNFVSIIPELGDFKASYAIGENMELVETDSDFGFGD